ncbi:MAG: DNA mismatch repair protein MutL [Alkaliphilus sp.]|nr:DNA mismatch repair endonuclease MutL [Alkaliphilus sp. AH-315-G20]PHS35988.1 MAG: DNA mismatch repair protein MutL [Alkaliphilus sp.]
MIKILSDLTINKIAAGEVVDGPFSVVKELVENAIDAGASIITVEIKDGGRKYIRVTDNGAGISDNEVDLAFRRHATSKIETLEDLSISTQLGFRGEALASIAAVSNVHITTRPSKQKYGISLELSAGKTLYKKEVGSPEGTTIIVKDLFFNTPVRLKFMKTARAETTRISEIITRLSLSNANVSFKFVNNNNIMFTTDGRGLLKNTIGTVLTSSLTQDLMIINNSDMQMDLIGFVAQTSNYRGNRNYEIFFVNGRFVKSSLLYRASEFAYKEKLPTNKFPICILNLSINPSEIDVNVHPSKTEIKFKDEEEVFGFVSNSISEVIEQNDVVPKLFSSKSESIKLFELKTNNRELLELNSNKLRGLGPKKQMTAEKPNNYSVTEKEKIKIERDSNFISDKTFNIIVGRSNNDVDENQMSLPSTFNKTSLNKLKNYTKVAEESNAIIYSSETKNKLIEEQTQLNFIADILSNYKFVGQLFNTYIIIESNSLMYLIDQHAAHERLIYNELLSKFNSNTDIDSQILLEPRIIDLAGEDFILLMANIEPFNKLGFNISEFGQNTIIIKEIPLILGAPRDFEFIFDLLDEIKDKKNHNKHFIELLIQKSCKSAIKANDKLNHLEIKNLLAELSTLKPPLTCPHGRPIVVSMSKYEIEKQFKRV